MNDVPTRIPTALQTTGAIVAAVPSDGWNQPTPCAEWTVREVTNHLVGGICLYTDELNGVAARAEHESDWLGADAVAAFQAAATDDVAAWARRDALTGTLTLGLGTLPAPLAAVIHLTEILVHGLDLAVAIDREDLADQNACAALLDTMEQMGGVDAYRVPGVFGPAVTISGHQPAHRRLLAYLGRTVTQPQSAHVG
ncbi:TIGR03086 family metal-binding protein [Terrabacter aeriphilus]|uniref:TIGR03086 family metal-binding protein n=1 Tax=Terrabacter aeriphilus TaxID=515662 RepID=A0ABP9JCS0_9MICO